MSIWANCHQKVPKTFCLYYKLLQGCGQKRLFHSYWNIKSEFRIRFKKNQINMNSCRKRSLNVRDQEILLTARSFSIIFIKVNKTDIFWQQGTNWWHNTYLQNQYFWTSWWMSLASTSNQNTIWGDVLQTQTCKRHQLLWKYREWQYGFKC